MPYGQHCNMFVIDFDDTLFDTHAFKRARLAAIRTLGVSEEVYWETYREARNDAGGMMTYSNERHATALAARGFSYEAILEKLLASVAQAREFLFPDAVSFLTFLKQRGRPLILLSLGEPSMQELKVRQSGLHDFFDRVFFVNLRKKEVLLELSKITTDCDCWLINDKVQETKELLSMFPQLQAVLKQSDSIAITEYEESGLPYFKTLSGLQHYIERYDK